MRGVTADNCERHLHQLHVCAPSKKGGFLPWGRPTQRAAPSLLAVAVCCAAVQPAAHACRSVPTGTQQQRTAFDVGTPSAWACCWCMVCMRYFTPLRVVHECGVVSSSPLVFVRAPAGTTRLLYRMSMDFLGWARFVPGIQKVWKGVAGQVLGEDLKLVLGQQDRLERGSDTWANPVSYDKLGECRGLLGCRVRSGCCCGVVPCARNGSCCSPVAPFPACRVDRGVLCVSADVLCSCLSLCPFVLTPSARACVCVACARRRALPALAQRRGEWSAARRHHQLRQQPAGSHHNDGRGAVQAGRE